MKRSLLFVFAGCLGCLQLAAQPGDTQSVGMQLAARNALFRVTVLNYFQNQQFDEALAYITPALQADSNNVQLLGYAGYAYYMTEDSRDALRCYERIIGLDSNQVTALHYLVQLHMGMQPAEAMDYARRLVLLEPGRAVRWRTMGELFARTGHPDSALVYFDQAYSLGPNDVRTIAGLADILLDARNFGRVDSIVDAALGKDSTNGTLLKLKVRSAYQQQRWAQTIVAGERLVQSDEPAIQPLTMLALSYYNLRQFPDCIRVCEHMLELGLTEESVYYYESRAWAKLKDYNKSDSLLQIALKLAIRPTAEWYYDDLAQNHEALRQYRQALANYDTAYYLFKDPTVLYACGRICETELHDLARAKRYYLRYLAVARPESKEEKEAYGYVRRRWGKP